MAAAACLQDQRRDDRYARPTTLLGEGTGVERLAIPMLRVVLVGAAAGATAIQASLVWVLITGKDVENGSARLTALRVATILGVAAVQVALACVWRLVGMVRRHEIFTEGAFRYVDLLTGAIVAVGCVWLAATAINAPDQRDDPGVTLIMGGIGVGIIGIAATVVVLRGLLAQAIARDVEARRLQAAFDEPRPTSGAPPHPDDGSARPT